jgi:hypothetical protein
MTLIFPLAALITATVGYDMQNEVRTSVHLFRVPGRRHRSGGFQSGFSFGTRALTASDRHPPVNFSSVGGQAVGDDEHGSQGESRAPGQTVNSGAVQSQRIRQKVWNWFLRQNLDLSTATSSLPACVWTATAPSDPALDSGLRRRA